MLLCYINVGAREGETTQEGFWGMHRVDQYTIAVTLVTVLAAAGVASAAVRTDTQALRNAVTVEGIMEHERRSRP